jgi:hypothetical protein
VGNKGNGAPARARAGAPRSESCTCDAPSLAPGTGLGVPFPLLSPGRLPSARGEKRRAVGPDAAGRFFARFLRAPGGLLWYKGGASVRVLEKLGLSFTGMVEFRGESVARYVIQRGGSP